MMERLALDARPIHQCGSKLRGMALLMVLWIVAALGIAVASVAYMVRGELRQTSALRSLAVDRAAARAAMTLFLRDLHAGGQRRVDRPAHHVYGIDGIEVDVFVFPLNGLLDINRASVALLAALLQYAGEVAPDVAQNLAVTMVERRSTRTSQGATAQFDAVEDLLEVPGIDYELYARLAPLVTANAGGSNQVNPYAAPRALLTVLAAGNQAQAITFLSSKESGGGVTGLNAAFITPNGATRLRLYARLAAVEQSKPYVTCDVSLVARDPGALPWEILQCDLQTTLMQ